MQRFLIEYYVYGSGLQTAYALRQQVVYAEHDIAAREKFREMDLPGFMAGEGIKLFSIDR